MSPTKKIPAGTVLPRLAKPLFARVGIVGFGLIGSSVARALRETRAAGEIHAFDSAPAVLRQVQSLSLADKTHRITVGKSIDPATVPALDFLLLATPLSAYETALTPLVPCLTKRTIVSDVGSVKGGVADLARLLPSPELLVPAHPLAGTEKSGPAAGFSTLFLDRYCLVVPHKDTATSARNKVVALWRAFGSRVEIVGSRRTRSDFGAHFTPAPRCCLCLGLHSPAPQGVAPMTTRKSLAIQPAAFAISHELPPATL